jgi:ADP-ribose pyrophosphatase
LNERTGNPLRQSAFELSDATVLETRIVHKDYARVERLTVEHALFAGGRSSRLTRELFISGDAVMVIPYDPALGCVLLIEQFRVAPLHHGEHPWIIEGIAGRIDAGEAPADVARREALEEAGCTLGEMEKIGRFYQSPGIFAERITYYCARADLSAAGGLFGLEDEGEDIRALVVPLEEALAALEDGHIVSAPTALALMWIDRKRRRPGGLWQNQPI